MHGVDARKRAAHTGPFLAKPMLPRSRKPRRGRRPCGDLLEDLPKIEASGRQSGDGTRRSGDPGGIGTRFTTAADFLLTLSVAHAQDQLKAVLQRAINASIHRQGQHMSGYLS